MSYKDLEAEIKAWANLEAYAKQQKEDKEEQRRQDKRDKRTKKAKAKGVLIPRSPAPKLDKPVRVYKDITLEVREIQHRKWGDIEKVTYTVETMSDTVAEVEAIKQARADGFSFDRVIKIVTREE